MSSRPKVLALGLATQLKWGSCEKLPAGNPDARHVLSCANGVQAWVPESDIQSDSGPAGPVGRRGFSSAEETLGPGERAFVNVEVPGHAVGDLAGAYKTSTTASTFPEVQLSIESTFTGSVRVRIWNTGDEEAELTHGSFTFWVQSSPTVAPEE